MKFLVEPVSAKNGGGSFISYYDENDKNRVYASAVVRGTITEKTVKRLTNGCKVPTLPFPHRLALVVRG
jgi:hypothetical protein